MFASVIDGPKCFDWPQLWAKPFAGHDEKQLKAAIKTIMTRLFIENPDKRTQCKSC